MAEASMELPWPSPSEASRPWRVRWRRDEGAWREYDRFWSQARALIVAEQLRNTVVGCFLEIEVAFAQK